MTAGFTLAIRSANPAGPCWLCDVAVAAKAGAESWPYPDGPPNSMAEPSSATEPSSVRRRADKNLRFGCSFITVMIVSLQNNVEPYWLSWRVAHVALRGPVGRINFVLGMLIRRNARRDENGRKRARNKPSNHRAGNVLAQKPQQNQSEMLLVFTVVSRSANYQPH